MRSRTTLAIDSSLLEAVDSAVRAGNARSRNEFFTRAVLTQLQQTRRQAINEAFAAMATDPGYQAEATETAASFAGPDWQALRFADC